jgi:iron complex outermembrane recepter protein
MMFRRPQQPRHGRLLSALLIACMLPALSGAAASRNGALFDMSIEELLNLEVTSVSKKAEPLAQTTSAVFVITQDDIRRHGSRSIPEALQLAPGLSVLQIDGNKWAIGSRGFSGRFANKLLVLMDGRVLYTSSFSGVFWDVQDTLMEDIERIEVIRGPGSTVWGANAVNGVINIITRKAVADTGGLVRASINNDGSRTAALSYDAALSEAINYRVFAQHTDMHGNQDLAGNDTADRWHATRGGARIDWSPTGTDAFSLIADTYKGKSGSTLQESILTPPYSVRLEEAQTNSGTSAIGRWVQQRADGGSTTAQVTLDATDRDAHLWGEKRRTYSLDLQHDRRIDRHNVVSGLTYRHNDYKITPGTTTTLVNNTIDDSLISAFIQDEITLLPNTLRVVLGTKLEHNTLSDAKLDVMPTLRLLWQTSPTINTWAAVTRAVRTPSQGDLSARVMGISPLVPPGVAPNPFPLPLESATNGSPNFKTEKLIAYEAGVRGQLSTSTSFDLALFHQHYKDLRAISMGGITCAPSGVSVAINPACLFSSTSVVTELNFTNDGVGNISGAELTMDWAISDSWRLHGSYTYLHEHLEARAPSFIASGSTSLSPRNQFGLRSEWSPIAALSLATSVRHISEVPTPHIDSYWTADAQANWQASEHCQLSLGAHNLFASARLETVSELNDVVPTRIESSVSLQTRLTF